MYRSVYGHDEMGQRRIVAYKKISKQERNTLFKPRGKLKGHLMFRLNMPFKFCINLICYKFSILSGFKSWISILSPALAL